MKYEHWKCEEGDLIIDEGNKHKDWLTKTGTLCCVIEAESWEEAMGIYHWYMGWEPHKPIG